MHANQTFRISLWLTATISLLCTTAGILPAQDDTPEDQLAETKQELESLRHEQRAINARVEMFEKRVAMQERLVDLWKQLKAARQQQDRALVRRLAERFEELEIELEQQEHVFELREQLTDARRAVRIARAINRKDLLAQANQVVKLQESLLEAVIALHEAHESGPEEKEVQLEDKVERLERSLGTRRDLLELEFELLEAIEEEDEERVEELEEVRQTLRKRLDRQAPEREKTEDEDPPAAALEIDGPMLAEVASQSFRVHAVKLLRQHCFGCHGNETEEGELNLESISQQQPLVSNLTAWNNAIEQLRNRVMPPADADPLGEAERRQLVALLHREVHQFDYSTIKDPGNEPARRLTHQEFNNTMRDLLGIDLRPADRFPTDLSGVSGFDNSANTLFMDSSLLERYIAAVEEVVNKAFPAEPVTSDQQRAHQRLFGKQGPDDEATWARQVLRRFLTRAYRRPSSPQELERSWAIYQQARDRGESFESAIKNVVRITLISPKFLLRVESPLTSSEAQSVSDWELASRLSYFLWASMPDDKLLELARQEQLHKPQVLDAQVTRMLADPRADTLGSMFAAQWLGSQHLGTRVRADPIDNPWCTETLMSSMRSETSMFVVSLIRDNRPVTELINARYTFLNEELAKHYGIDGIEGQQMRRVSLAESNRGGILAHASLLAVTSFPYRTSPVVRGKWILSDILGTPPPPPPPNASELDERIQENRRLTIKEKLELHRRKPNCYACHSQMDPLGFSLENYDWFGRFRTHRRRTPIDANSRLPDGTELSGLNGLKTLIVDRRTDDLVRQTTRKMLAYALGRQLEYFDEGAVRQIIKDLKQHDNRFQHLVRNIVNSYPFRYRQLREVSSD